MEKCRTLGVIIFITISLCLRTCLSQQAAAPTPASSVLPKDACNGVFLSYNYTGGNRIPPINAPNQAYRFTSTVTVLNNWADELKSWRVFVGFQHNELLVSATNAVLADGSSLPAFVGNGTTLVGFPQTDLKSAIETAGDVNQMEAIVQLVGTQFGIASPDVPLPSRLSLDNDGYSCPAPTLIPQGNELYVCCIKNSNISLNGVVGDNFQPREDGDLIIMYDVIRAYSTDYWAQVSISNHDNLGRLDNWQLSWEWMRGEFIYAMRGARPLVADVRDCIFGDQGRHYEGLDFSQALSCERIPTIIDLPPTRANDTDIGGIPFCCRNGTILPPIMDVTKSKSVFQMHVYKMPPDLNMSGLYAPQNWKINGTFSSDYQCGNPVPVSPSEFPDPTGLPSETAAIASWRVVCNITKLKDEHPKCCVSFSAFYNDSVVPCSTCACGCNNNPSQTCSASEPAILLPSSALLLPFENRTELALNWAEMKRISVPNPLPCGDNCGVSINWHILSDYRGGWTARITLFNWGETNLADWSAAVELDKAVPGFEKVYSFNGTVLPDSNNTIFMRGLLDFNYLLAEREGKNPKKDPRVPGLQQSVISFTKKNTPGINVPGGDGFPTKVFFNGEECALPTIRPSNGYKIRPAASPLGLLMILALFWIRL